MNPFKLMTPAVVPLVGQPFMVKGWFPTVQIVCACDAHEPVLCVGVAPSACPACGRVFQVQDIVFHAKTDQMQISLAVAPAPLETRPS